MPPRPQRRSVASYVDLTEDDIAQITHDLVDLTVEERVEAAIDLTIDTADLETATPQPENREKPIPEGFDSIPSHSLKGKTYKPGDGVDLEDDEFTLATRGSRDCFRIVHIIRNHQTREVRYRGYRLSSTNQQAKVKRFLPRSFKTRNLCNEYCIMAPTISDLESGNLEQCLITLDPRDVLGPREIIFTNELFPRYSHFEDPRFSSSQYRTKGEARKAGQIVVRLKFATALNKSGTSVVQGRIERLRQEEVDMRYRAIDAKLRENCRSSTSKVAARCKKRTHSDFDEEKTYTIGSVCTGAGGSLVGAAQAGLKPVFAVDRDEVVRQTIHLNFGKYRTRVPDMDAFEFCTSPKQGYEETDVLEVSWPCPYWSPAKTRDHSDPEVDSNNMSCIFSTGDLLMKCNPRIATLEQTSGLVTHWPDVFESFINQITSSNYSVCWEVPDLAEYGAYSHRRRLLVIAACPGEPLPTFPRPTHGTGPGMKPFVAIRDATREAENTPDPDDLASRAGGPRRRAERSHNGRRLLLGTPTTGGIVEPHLNGVRSFNLFESSLLCGFPSYHRFAGNNVEVKRQQGNAFPSCCARTMFEHAAKSMREFDRKIASSPREIITLD